MDKAVFALTRAIIGNKRARSFFVIYTAGLVSHGSGLEHRFIKVADLLQHLLILFVLYGSMAASDSGHAAIPLKPIG